MFLTQAEENRPLYIVDIEDASVERWLLLAGIAIGDPVWNIFNNTGKNSVWVGGDWGQVILSPSMTSGLLVQKTGEEDGNLFSLDLLPVGSTGRIVKKKKNNRYSSFFDMAGYPNYAEINLFKRFSGIDFHIDIAGYSMNISDETAFNIWHLKYGRWIQLGAQLIGQQFWPEACTGNKAVGRDFETLVGRESVVTLKEISMRGPDVAVPSFIIKSQAGNTLSLDKKEADCIDVRLCDICWSCGSCK